MTEATRNLEDQTQYLQLAIQENEESIILDIEKELNLILNQVNNFEIECLFNQENDNNLYVILDSISNDKDYDISKEYYKNHIIKMINNNNRLREQTKSYMESIKNIDPDLLMMMFL